MVVMCKTSDFIVLNWMKLLRKKSEIQFSKAAAARGLLGGRIGRKPVP
jgi:hypothetical protein